MSLPPGFLDELRNRLTLSDVVGKKVMWDKRKSQPGKGDLWAPCPFHHEKPRLSMWMIARGSTTALVAMKKGTR